MSRSADVVVEVLAFSAGVTDSRGNSAESWPSVGAGVDVSVYGVAPKLVDEGVEAGRRSVPKVYELFAPSSVSIAARDRVVVDGDVFEVDGEPEVWGSGPYASGGVGVVCRLMRVEG